MAATPITINGGSMPRKRQKLNSSTEQSSHPSLSSLLDPNPYQTTDVSSSSFTFTEGPPLSTNRDYILDINKYIPVGCLRIQRSDCGISNEAWKSCNSWSAFAHPRDVYNEHRGKYLLNALQETLLNSPVVRPYRVLHNSGWIRMEFMSKDQHTGQVRVYILPDDVGNGQFDRKQSAPRRAMQLLLAQLDIARATWNGQWLEDIPVAHVDSSLDGREKDRASLFYLFNTLPSPKPDPEIVQDKYAKDAMYRILDSDIEGLNTTMHPYQRRTAAMMLQRESQPSQIIDPRLRAIVDQKGITWYCDLDASLCLKEPRTYESARGGICAETMGLGKTLICLSLILATKELSSQIPVEYSCGTVPVRKTTGSLRDMTAATIGRTGTPWKGHFDRMRADGFEFSQCIEAIRKGAGHYFLPSPAPRRESRNPVVVTPRKIWLSTATLVVVPPNLVRQWELEIKKHTTGLKVLVLKKSRAKDPLPSAKELAEYDIILFSKQRFDQEAADGSDSLGRRKATSSNVCRCPYIENTTERDCTCFREQDAYRSPLKDLHIKRLITDEGHTFGNASKSSRTEGVTVVEFLQLTSRWIVSGTPTQGLYGVEVSLSNSEDPSESGTPVGDDSQLAFPGSFSKSLAAVQDSDENSQSSTDHELVYKQERKDLEKLGNIATLYLKARPWANTYQDGGDIASWSQHVLQPRHGSKSHGNMDCLRATLEGMIIRHRPEDVEQDIILPPLHQASVYIDGSIQDKLSLNFFAMQIVINAVTSERKDADYLFHPRQRKALNLLVSNLRQASFHWSGFTMDEIFTTIDVAKKFLEKGEVPVSTDDENLLQEAIKFGEIFIANNIKKCISHWHEMPMYIQNEFPSDVRAAWALDGEDADPTLMGATMVHAAQNFVGKQLYKSNPMDGLVDAGKQSLKSASIAANPPPPPPTSRPQKKSYKEFKSNRKSNQHQPTLAGGVTIASESVSPKKRARASSASAHAIIAADGDMELLADDDTAVKIEDDSTQKLVDEQLQGMVKPKSAMKQSKRTDVTGTFDPASPLASASIVSSSSAKLSYLMDKIVIQHQEEKILIFYDGENVAYHIAQALECLHIKHLIYAKSLPSSRKAQYVVTFNQTETFRVLLMDISQAAFGLDISTASRVYFVNPVFSPQVEAQAVKRAHRIGQTKPVYIETLVLNGSIEEVILDRRKDMTNDEHNKCKSILEDQTMYNWIRNVQFLPVPIEDISGPDQMAALQTPQLLFDRGSKSQIGDIHDPDADLVMDDVSPKAKGKRKAKVAFAESDSSTDFWGSSLENETSTIDEGDNVRGLDNLKGDQIAQTLAMEFYASHFSMPSSQTTRRREANSSNRYPETEGSYVFQPAPKASKNVAFQLPGDIPDNTLDAPENHVVRYPGHPPPSPNTVHRDQLELLNRMQGHVWGEDEVESEVQDPLQSPRNTINDDLNGGAFERFINATSQQPQFHSGNAHTSASLSEPGPSRVGPVTEDDDDEIEYITPRKRYKRK